MNRGERILDALRVQPGTSAAISERDVSEAEHEANVAARRELDGEDPTPN